METKMQRTILTLLTAALISALTAQAATAAERHHMRTKVRAVASEQFRNSNAYVPPDNIALQSDLQDYANGAMASGIAGH
jgi:hypothetical protein